MYLLIYIFIYFLYIYIYIYVITPFIDICFNACEGKYLVPKVLNGVETARVIKIDLSKKTRFLYSDQKELFLL